MRLSRITLAIACIGWMHSAFAQETTPPAQDVAPETTPASTWPDPATSPAEMLDVARIQRSLMVDAAEARDRAVIVGDRGHILVSESRSEWRQVPVPTRTLLTAVSAVDNRLWAVGHDQVIVYSSDGGLTWTLQNSDIASEGPLLDVLFLDAERGFAVGAYGQFLSTTDSGATWTKEVISDRVAGADPLAAPIADMEEGEDDSMLASTDVGEDEGDPHLNAITRVSAGLLIVGEAGAVYRSIDNGATWERSDLPYDGSMFALVPLDNGRVIAAGLRGNVFITGDLGRTWQAMNSGTEASLFGGTAVPGGRAVLVGASGTVLLAPADTLDLRLFTFGDGGTMSAAIPISESEFVLVGENGVANYSPN